MSSLENSILKSNIKYSLRKDYVDHIDEEKVYLVSKRKARGNEEYVKDESSTCTVIISDLNSSEEFNSFSQNSIETDHRKATDKLDMKCCRNKKGAKVDVKPEDRERKQSGENTDPAIVIPCRGSGSTGQRTEDLPKEANKMPRLCKRRVRKKDKDSIKMKVKIKKLPIKDLGYLNHGDDSVIGGIFRLHVCNQQEGKRLEKIKKKKNCRIHRIPLLSGAVDDDVPDEWFERKVWNTLCHYPHLGSHAREDYYRRIIKWRKGHSSAVSKGECILCEIQQLASKPLYKDIDTVHYSHDFYEIFSRQSRNIASSASPDDAVDVQFCLKNRTPPPAPPASSLGSTPSSPLPRLYSNIVSPCKMNKVTAEVMRVPSQKSSPDPEYTVSRASDLQALYVPKFKVTHQQCSPRLPPVQLAPTKNPNYLDFVHRRTAFKAYTPKKEINPKKGNVPPRQKFAVRELGVTYFLPDQNQNLAGRHVSIPKSYTYVPQPPPKDQLTSTWIPPHGKRQVRQIVSNS